MMNGQSVQQKNAKSCIGGGMLLSAQAMASSNLLHNDPGFFLPVYFALAPTL